MVGPPGLSVEVCLHPGRAVLAYPTGDVVQTWQLQTLRPSPLINIQKSDQQVLVKKQKSFFSFSLKQETS